MVIFDTPPLGSVIDAAVIASKTDATIMVIQPKKVDYKLAQSVKGQLEKANARILGVVLNRVDKSRNHKQYYYLNDYYGGKPSRAPIRERKLRQENTMIDIHSHIIYVLMMVLPS